MKALFFALTLLISLNAFAQETRDAWVAESSFDGQTYSYKVIAYDTTGPVTDFAKTECVFGEFKTLKYLKALRVRVMVTAAFDQSESQVEKSGKVDVRAAINSCMDQLGTKGAVIKGPVEIQLPPISVSTLSM